MKIKKRSEFPKCVQGFKELKGICVGECVNNEELGKDFAAHAHCDDDDMHKGWICVRCKFHLKSRLILLHEMAHLIANRSSKVMPHGKEWKRALLSIGGTFKSFVYNRKGLKARETLDYTYRNRKQ